MKLISLVIALSIASGFATMVDVNFITGTAFLGDVMSQNGTFLDNENECLGVGVGAYCRSEIGQDERFCVSVIQWPFPVIRKEFYFCNGNNSNKAAKLSFWGASFDPQYSNENEGIYLVNTANVFSNTGCTKL